jgi:hypothetical protein
MDCSAMLHTFRVIRGNSGIDYTLVTIALTEVTPIIEIITVMGPAISAVIGPYHG